MEGRVLISVAALARVPRQLPRPQLPASRQAGQTVLTEATQSLSGAGRMAPLRRISVKSWVSSRRAIGTYEMRESQPPPL